MNIEYKFWYIKRNDDGFITETAVRFYQGKYIKDEYVREKRLLENDLKFLKDKKTIIESNELPTKLFNQEDLGMIKTDDEICNFLNKILEKDTTRQPIKEQICLQ